jgi:alpha-galactosidase
VASGNGFCVYKKQLADGSIAVGLFNLGNDTAAVTARWTDLKIHGQRNIRDLWRQKDLGKFKNEFSTPVAAHSAELVKLSRNGWALHFP